MPLNLYLNVIILWFCIYSKTTNGNSTVCFHSKKESAKISILDSNERLASNADASQDHTNVTKSVENCSQEQKYCYSLWQQDAGNESLVVLAQGCWDASSGEDCRRDECVSNRKPTKALNNTKFCCCSGYMCNVNVTDGYNPLIDTSIEDESSPQVLQTPQYKSHLVPSIAILTVLVILVFVILLLLFLHLSLLTFASKLKQKKKSLDSVHLVESQTCQSVVQAYDFGNLRLQELIGQGRYGSVRKGVLNDQNVAVKIFSCHHKQYYQNEKEIYMLPLIDHPSILKFLGADEKSSGLTGGDLEYHLVFSYAPLGCLQDFLRSNTLDWFTLCKMTQSIAIGLSHLHAEIQKGDKKKPCVAHRDLSSRNILVKTDKTCMICDFGFAIQISGSKCFVNGVEQNAETTSLSDVGTLRYMAPEILEGAVNLRDFESSLKQIDMYALGLIMWEIASRCSDLYQGMDVPIYKQPFEHEVGLSPTYELMQVLVTRHKARPLFPDIWKDSNPAIRALKETIDDCWDHDAEARLTALCVVERLHELPTLWERYKTGTVSAAVSSHLGVSQPTSIGSFNQRNILSVRNTAHDAQSINSLNDQTHEKLTNKQNDVNSNSSETEETIVSSSESEKNFNFSHTNYLTQPARVTLPLQPYQGRNPCLERNLMLETSDETNSKFLQQGFKFRPKNNGVHLLSPDIESNAMENQALVNSDILSHTTSARSLRRGVGNSALIPVIKNNIKAPMPKQPNLPRNGHNSIPIVNVYRTSESWPSKVLRMWTKSAAGVGFRNLFERRKCDQTSNDCDTLEAEPLSSGQQCQRTLTENTMVISSTSLSSNNLDKDTFKETKVYLANGSATTGLIRVSNICGAEVTQTNETVPKTGH